MTDDRLTIFHVNGERGFRGGERQLIYLAAALRARGHLNVVCCRAGGELERESRRQGLETLSLPFFFEFDPVSAWVLARAAARRRPAVVHAHTGHASGIALLCRWFGGPGTVAHRRVVFPLRTFSALKYARMDRLVAVSNAIAEALTRDGLPTERISVIHDAIPTSTQEWEWLGVSTPTLAPVDDTRRHAARRALAESDRLDQSKRWIGNLAALGPDKDHETLISAAAIVLEQRPNVLFLIAGRGPEEPRLRSIIVQLGLLDGVVLLGHREEPGAVLAALDLFVLSSRDEGLGSVLLEAAACGVATVATAVGGVPEVVHHGETGLLVPPGDAAALARSIITLLDDIGLTRRLAAAAFEALPRFGLTRAAERFEGLYRIVAAG